MKAAQFSIVSLVLFVGLAVGFSAAHAQSNNPPVANAGPDQTVTPNATVMLDGTGSSDPDGDQITYEWVQFAGTAVTLANANTAQPTFTAPSEPPCGQETLTFNLTVRDTQGANSSDLVNVSVQPGPPDCTSAQPSVSILQPANHKFQAVSVVGITDPNGVSIEITGIFQDEPVLGGGTGNTAPDAVINPDGTMLLRAESASRGDGRIYHIGFTATDPCGRSCSGTVTVCVPGRNGACVDEGPLYNSTQH